MGYRRLKTSTAGKSGNLLDFSREPFFRLLFLCVCVCGVSLVQPSKALMERTYDSDLKPVDWGDRSPCIGRVTRKGRNGGLSMDLPIRFPTGSFPGAGYEAWFPFANHGLTSNELD